MSGTFNLLFTRASEAAFSAYNVLSSLFNLAGLPAVNPTFINPKPVDLSSDYYYDSTVLSNPDLLFTCFKSRFQQQVENHWFKPIVQNFISSGNLKFLDTELQNYLDHYFPQLNFLLSDKCSNFIASHLPHLHPVDAQSFCESLSGYLNKLWEDLESHVNYEDKISDFFLETRNKIAGLKSYLQSSVKTFEKPFFPIFPKLSSIAQAVLSYMASNPLQTFSMGLLLTPKVSAQTLTHNYTLNIGTNFLEDIGAEAGCNMPNGDLITVCPMSGANMIGRYIQPSFSAFPSFLSISTITDIDNPNVGDMACLGTIPVSARFGYSAFVAVPQYSCPQSTSPLMTCSLLPGFNMNLDLWVPNHPPFLLTTNTTPSYLDTPLGAQPITPISASFHGSPYINPPVDADADTLKYSTRLLFNGTQISIPDWMNIDSTTGVISGSIPTAYRGKYIFISMAADPFNAQNIQGQDFNPTTQYSNVTVQFPLIPPQTAPQISRQPSSITSAQSFISFALPLPINSYAKDSEDDPIIAGPLMSANATTLPSDLFYSVSDQTLYWTSPNPIYRTGGGLWVQMPYSDQPGPLCTKTTAPGCLPLSSLTSLTAPFLIPLKNTAPIQLANPPLSSSPATIGTPISINALQSFYDQDRDTMAIRSVIQTDQNPSLEPNSIDFNSSSGLVTVNFQKGAKTGVNYQFVITIDDAHGGQTSGTWTLTLTARAPVITLPPSTLISTLTGLAAQTTLTPPYRNLDIAPSQLNAFFALTQFNSSLPSTALSFTYNATTQRFDVFYNFPNTAHGTWLIQISHPGSEIPLQTTAQAISPGPQIIQPLVLTTGASGTYYVSPSFDTFFLNPDSLTPMTVIFLNLQSGFIQNTTHVFGLVNPRIAGTYSLTAQVQAAGVSIISVGSMTIPYLPLIPGNIRVNGIPASSNNFTIETNTNSLVDFSQGASDPNGGTPNFSFSRLPAFCTLISQTLWQCFANTNQQGFFSFSATWDNGHTQALTQEENLIVILPPPSNIQSITTNESKAGLGLGAGAAAILLIAGCSAYGIYRCHKKKTPSGQIFPTAGVETGNTVIRLDQPIGHRSPCAVDMANFGRGTAFSAVTLRHTSDLPLSHQRRQLTPIEREEPLAGMTHSLGSPALLFRQYPTNLEQPLEQPEASTNTQ